jgi:hypothetical protein
MNWYTNCRDVELRLKDDAHIQKLMNEGVFVILLSPESDCSTSFLINVAQKPEACLQKWLSFYYRRFGLFTRPLRPPQLRFRWPALGLPPVLAVCVPSPTTETQFAASLDAVPKNLLHQANHALI